ncbi:MAG: preprotein translocase subunit YajC [Sphingomonadales bacterium]|nr:preprotein translocase subunit YajC [Sphingomonadales bacterium]
MTTSSLSFLAAAAASADQPPAWLTYLPLIAMGFAFWFLILRPQMRQQKEQRNKIAAIKKGDQVLTGGGLVGKISRVIDDNYVEVELAQGFKVKALKSTIADIIPPVGSAPAND